MAQPRLLSRLDLQITPGRGLPAAPALVSASPALGPVREQPVPKLVQRPAGALAVKAAPLHLPDRDSHELRGVPGSWRLRGT
jgi:hypothetical protein